MVKVMDLRFMTRFQQKARGEARIPLSNAPRIELDVPGLTVMHEPIMSSDLEKDGVEKS